MGGASGGAGASGAGGGAGSGGIADTGGVSGTGGTAPGSGGAFGSGGVSGSGGAGSTRLQGGIVTVASGVVKTSSVRLVEHGLARPGKSCGMVQGNNVCVTGGIKP